MMIGIIGFMLFTISLSESFDAANAITKNSRDKNRPAKLSAVNIITIKRAVISILKRASSLCTKEFPGKY